MKKETIRSYFNHKLAGNLGDKISFSNIETVNLITKKNLNHIVSIFKIWRDYITPKSYATFLSTLLRDLANLHCCAVSSNFKSPCYIGSQAASDPIATLPTNEHELYTGYTIKADCLITEPSSMGFHL